MKSFLLLFITAFVVNETFVLAKGPGRIPLSNQCCNVTQTSGKNEKVETAMKECGQEQSANGEQCMPECVGKKLNILNSDGSLNEDGFRSFVTNDVAKEDYKKAVADAAVTKCIKEAKKASANDGKCSKIAMIVGRCIQIEMFKACPADKQDTSEHCVKKRKDFESGRPKGRRGPKPPKEDAPAE